MKVWFITSYPYWNTPQLVVKYMRVISLIRALICRWVWDNEVKRAQHAKRSIDVAERSGNIFSPVTGLFSLHLQRMVWIQRVSSIHNVSKVHQPLLDTPLNKRTKIFRGTDIGSILIPCETALRYWETLLITRLLLPLGDHHLFIHRLKARVIFQVDIDLQMTLRVRMMNI